MTDTIEERTDHKAGERVLGTDPKTGQTVSVKISRFGPVAQIGTSGEGEKPRFASLRKGQSLATITLDEALHLFDLPRDLGEWDGEMVTIGTGRLGPYVRHAGKFTSIPKGIDPLAITLDEAKAIVTAHQQEEQKKILRTFDEDATLQVIDGRYGPYLKHGDKNYKIPRGTKHETLTYADCQAIMEAADSAEGKDAKPRRGRFSRKK